MSKEELRPRTKRFALRIIQLVESLPRGRSTEVIGRQLLRSGTSVGANYRAACRAKSPADFISKMGIVEEEADESLFWMELLVEAGLIERSSVRELMSEADAIIAMVVTSIRTTRNNGQRGSLPVSDAGKCHEDNNDSHSAGPVVRIPRT